jgi:transcriptional regulator with XRE-family HTH domain
MDPDEEVLAGVGARLRAVRRDRGTTLAQLARDTGISVSTLSRLESGQRRATLELLLPLARAHQVALDELVGAPQTGDPRIHPRPVHRHGNTLLPLSRRPGGLQAYKMIMPPWTGEVEQRTHEGYDWMYVLSGRVRLLLGEHDLVLSPGEVAEFDTRTPHGFYNPGPGDTEVLALFGPGGERIHTRARPSRQSGT